MKTKTKKGFSLLELMTITGIIAIMTGVSLMFIGDNRNRVELESAANETVAALREAQNYSLTGKKAGGNDCSRYIFEPSASTNNYTISGYYVDSSGSTLSCGFSMQYTLTGNVNFSNGNTTVSFDAPHGDVSDTSVSLTKNGKNYYVCVKNTGLITKVDNLPCP